ncbi:MAG: hypothetical protein Q9188_002534 [Gyalolechia gomerana]
MHLHSFLSIPVLLLSLPLAHAQDQCNLLPVAIQSLPLTVLNSSTLTICERYTPANSTQYAWISKLINLAFTGDYTPLPDVWPANPNGTYQASGLLDPNAVYRDPCGEVMGINLVPYFNGTWKSNNRGGKPVAINFLDGGGVTALKSGVPAWDVNSSQHRLLTHFYQYFGLILGCTSPSFPRYTGPASQFQIHRYMDLSAPEMHYFIHNIYDAALTLGIAGPDLVTHVGDAISIGVGLDNVFNKKCAPPVRVAGYQESALQGICGDERTCAKWAFPNATCALYNQTGFGTPPALADKATPSAGGYCGPRGI